MIAAVSRGCRKSSPSVGSLNVPRIGRHTRWNLGQEDGQCLPQSEAAVLFLRHNPAGQKYLTRLARKHGKGKALTILAHTLARAVYDMLKRDTAFALDTCLRESWSRAGEPAASLAADGISLAVECWQR
jgi:hypothetical protein